MTIIGYVRDSTSYKPVDEQMTTLGNCDVIFKDVTTEYSDERTGLMKMLDFVSPGDIVVVTEMHTIAYSLEDLIKLIDFIQDKKASLRILNPYIDTNNANICFIKSIFTEVHNFQNNIRIERQSLGIQRAKNDGKYKGRTPSARSKSEDVHKLLKEGFSKTEVSKELGISLSSVYRIIKE